MTFKVLIIEDNHSFIDSLKVMLRDLPLDFEHAFRYADAQSIIEKAGVFHNKAAQEETSALVAEATAAVIEAASGNKKRPSVSDAKLYNEGGVFLVIVEQNTETSMKGTDFIAHAVRKFPGLSESDFVLLTHRMELVPAKNHNFPVLEKPLRAPQIRQILTQKVKQAQDLVDMQVRLAAQKIDSSEKTSPTPRAKRKGFRDLLKMNRPAAENETEKTEEKKPAKKTRKAAAKKGAKKTAAAPKRKARAK